jgi:hypothetical protein
MRYFLVNPLALLLSYRTTIITTSSILYYKTLEEEIKLR